MNNAKHKLIQGDNSVLDVSKYIVNYCIKNQFSITNLKLQKLLYFCEASFLLNTDSKRACFSEPIVAWPYGPVVVEVYEHYSRFGSSEITERTSISKNDIKHVDYIDEVLSVAAKLNPFKLVDLTHEQRPWINAYSKGVNTRIFKDDIYDYYLEQSN